MLEAAAIFVLTAAYGALHSLLAARGTKEWAVARFGPRAKRVYRLAYNAIALGSFVPVFALLVWYPGQVLYRIPLPWSALALTGQGASMVLLAIGLLQTDARSFLGLRQLCRRRELRTPVVDRRRSLPVGAPSSLHRWPGAHLAHAGDDLRRPGTQPGAEPLHRHRLPAGGTPPHRPLWPGVCRVPGPRPGSDPTLAASIQSQGQVKPPSLPP